MLPILSYATAYVVLRLNATRIFVDGGSVSEIIDWNALGRAIAKYSARHTRKSSSKVVFCTQRNVQRCDLDTIFILLVSTIAFGF